MNPKRLFAILLAVVVGISGAALGKVNDHEARIDQCETRAASMEETAKRIDSRLNDIQAGVTRLENILLKAPQ